MFKFKVLKKTRLTNQDIENSYLVYDFNNSVLVYSFKNSLNNSKFWKIIFDFKILKNVINSIF